MTTSAPRPQVSSRGLLRSKLFWLALLFAIYNVIGWLLVPYIAEQQLKKQLHDIAGWTVSLKDLHFNPYRLSADIHQLNANNADGERVVAWQHLHVNYSAVALLEGIIAFDEIALSQPYVRVILDESGTSNFQKDFASDAPAEPVAEENTNDEPVKLYFGDIRIDEGHIELADWTQGDAIHFDLEPVSLELSNFRTHDNDGGNYDLRLSLGQGQILQWQGELGIAPFYSRGKIALQNIRSQSFWHYLKDHSPLWLHEALISVEAEYDTRGKQGTSLRLADGAIRIEGLDARQTANSEASVLQLDQLTLGPIQFDLEERNLALGNLIFAAPIVNVEREADGSLPLLTAFAGKDSTTEAVPADENPAPSNTEGEPSPTANTVEKNTTETAPPWRWQLDRLVLNQGVINWRDAALRNPADLQIRDLDIAVQDLSDDLSRLSPYAVQFEIDGSRHQTKGLVAAQPFNLQGAIDLRQFPLASLQPYLAESANVQIDAGTLSIEGDYALEQAGQLSGKLALAMQVSDLATTDTRMRKSLAGFSLLRIAPIEVALEPLSITVGEVLLQQPYSEVFINEAGEMNLAMLAVSPDDSAAAAKPAATPAATSTEAKTAPAADSVTDKNLPTATTVPVSIERISLQQGRVDFSDSSQNPPFNTYLAELNGEVLGISSTSPQASDLSLTGKVDQFGSLRSKGKLNLLDVSQPTAFTVQVQNINLSSLSTYGARYVGYPIDRGKLDLDLDYQIRKTTLDAKNHVIIDNLELGKRSDSDQALKLPLPLALGILENTKGVIDIKLPVSGDLSDPGFSLGNVLFTAFTNLLTKAIASPFTILGSIIGGGADLSEAKFDAGQAELASSEQQRLRQLAEALRKRPNLNLEIRGQADRKADLAGLQAARLQEALSTVKRDNALAQRATLAAQWNQQETYEQIAQRFAEQRGSEAHLAELDAALQSGISIAEVDFVQLAKARASTIVTSLTEQHEIAAERLFVLEPQVVETSAKQTTVAIPFSINVR